MTELLLVTTNIITASLAIIFFIAGYMQSKNLKLWIKLCEDMEEVTYKLSEELEQARTNDFRDPESGKYISRQAWLDLQKG